MLSWNLDDFDRMSKSLPSFNWSHTGKSLEGLNFDPMNIKGVPRTIALSQIWNTRMLQGRSYLFH